MFVSVSCGPGFSGTSWHPRLLSCILIMAAVVMRKVGATACCCHLVPFTAQMQSSLSATVHLKSKPSRVITSQDLTAWEIAAQWHRSAFKCGDPFGVEIGLKAFYGSDPLHLAKEPVSPPSLSSCSCFMGNGLDFAFSDQQRNTGLCFSVFVT